MSSPIRLDAGTRHVLAWCIECPGWRVLTGDRAAAHRAAADHADRCHHQAETARDHRRHARNMHGS